LLERLHLEAERVIDENPYFYILLCRGPDRAQLVLKYVHTSSPDAFRRLRNEAALIRYLHAEAPDLSLRYREHGRSHLLTDFDSGELLRPHRLNDDAVRKSVAEALVRFHSTEVDPAKLGINDREHLVTYYLKIVLKNIVHLIPSYLTWREGMECLSRVVAALPAILERTVPCHGDFLPTNLLYHGDDASTTVTDLEGFITGNHPLFDVVALMTTDEGDVAHWQWQSGFLNHYLGHGGANFGLDSSAPELRTAYRGILTFFLLYRLSEARIAWKGVPYFDGLGKGRYLGRKAMELARRATKGDDDDLTRHLEVRRRNLRLVLSSRDYLSHEEAMFPPPA